MSSTRQSRAGVVFIAEDEDGVFTGTEVDHYLTGRFHGHLDKANRAWDSFEGLDLEEALAWARERADRIVVRVGYGPEYTIGFRSGSRRPWPDGGIPQPSRRRIPDEAWKDRTEVDPDATWTARIALAPPQVADDRRRPEWDAGAADFAEQLGGSWSADSLDGWYAVMRAAARHARRSPTGEAGWVTQHVRAYEIAATVSASTADAARTAAQARMPALPEGWSVSCVVVEFVNG